MTTTRSISKRRLWLFRLIAFIVIPALMIVFMEMGLRVFGVGYPTHFTLKCDVNGQDAYCDNDNFSWRFFPPKMARPPIPFVIPAEKSSDTYRIFILGASAAQGDPEHTFGVSRVLETLLRDQYPGINFEVINGAITAINSHTVLQIAKDLTCHDGDLSIVYLGNNEVVGPFGAGTVFAPLSSSLWLIRTGIFLKSTRIGQLLGKLLTLAGEEETTSKEWGGMQMFLERQVRADAPGLKQVYSHFRRNLEDICRVTKKAGIKTIVSTVASNLKETPPFASLHRVGITEDEKKEWEEFYRAGIEFESAGLYTNAIREYLEAERIDGHFADLQYRLGRSYWALEDYEKAREKFIRARDLDTLRFRADTTINNIIRSVAEEKVSQGIYLVDAVKAFEENSPHGIPDDGLFYEHVHMSFRGNYILAKNLIRQIAKILPDWVQNARSNQMLLAEGECKKRLAFTGYDQYRVVSEVFNRLKKPPFTNQLFHKEHVKQITLALEGLQTQTQRASLEEAASQYRWAIQNAAQDPWLHYNFAGLLESSQNPKGAAEQYRMFLRYLPLHAAVHEDLIRTLIELGGFDEALAQCQRALQISPDFTPFYYHRAFALAGQDRLEQSIQTYQELLLLDPDNTVEIHNQIGQIRIKQNRLHEAVEEFQKAVAFNVESRTRSPVPDVHFNLAYVLKRMGRSEESVQELRKAAEGYREELKEHPDADETHIVLGRTLTELGDLNGASDHFQKAVHLKPLEPGNQINLIRSLNLQGRHAEALEAAQKAIQLMRLEGHKESAATLEKYLLSLKPFRLNEK